jgi:hypothetical protein
MGLLSDFFIAKPDAAKLYGGDTPFPAADRCQHKNLSPLQAAQIFAVMRGIPYDVSLLDEFPLVHEETDGGPWTVKIPDEMVTALAQLPDSEIGPQSLAWAEATAEELAWGAEDFEPIVGDLVRLAGAARASGRSMFLWNCL